MESTKKIQSYRDLIVWQKAVRLVTDVYETTKAFPKEEQFGLTSQIRRSAISIPSNIAEGYGRRSRNEYQRFLNIAIGSLYELQTQLIISANMEFIKTVKADLIAVQCNEIEKMLNSLVKKLSN